MKTKPTASSCRAFLWSWDRKFLKILSLMEAGSFSSESIKPFVKEALKDILRNDVEIQKMILENQRHVEKNRFLTEAVTAAVLERTMVLNIGEFHYTCCD